MDITQKQKIALVLSGGGTKAAAFHIGVCLALKKLGFTFNKANKSLNIDLYVGSSAGAVISTFLACGYDIESLIGAFEAGAGIPLTNSSSSPLKPLHYHDMFSFRGINLFNLIPNFLNRRSLITGGLETLIKKSFKLNGIFTTKGLEKYLRNHVIKENNFMHLSVPLYIVTTQLDHSRKVVFGPYAEEHITNAVEYASYASISEAVAASTALPPVFAPYGIKKSSGEVTYFFDGVIRDTLSSHVALEQNCDLIICSHSVQPYHLCETVGSLQKFGIPVIINQAIYQLIEQKIQKEIEFNKIVHDIYQFLDVYMNNNNYTVNQRKEVLEAIAKITNYKHEVNHIYIGPGPQDYEMFFYDHFSLSPKILAKISKIGYRSTMEIFSKYGLVENLSIQ